MDSVSTFYNSTSKHPLAKDLILVAVREFVLVRSGLPFMLDTAAKIRVFTDGGMYLYNFCHEMDECWQQKQHTYVVSVGRGFVVRPLPWQ